jgi:glycosyltransferase involved in cell wall biosynthesis
MDKIAIFREDIFPAGGIETWLYNLAVIYGKKYDITIYYNKIAQQQRMKLGKLVKLREYTGQDIEVDRAIFCFDMMGYDTTTAKKNFYVVHADYKNIKGVWRLPDDVEVYAVSKVAQKSARKVLGCEVGLLYNPVLRRNPPKHYSIISVTRLSKEKGLWRMRLLAAALDRNKVNYTWHIYAPFVSEGIDSPNVVFHEPTNEAQELVEQADFLVQLSDTESFGYSMVEAMVLNVGLIVTDIPVLGELNINKNNAIIVPLGAKAKWRYDKIVKRILQFRVDGSYQPPVSDYSVVLGEPSEIDYNPTVIQNELGYDFFVEQLGEYIHANDILIVEDKKLAKKILKNKFLKAI